MLRKKAIYKNSFDLAAIRKILETEAGATCCPSCDMPFDKGKKRKLIDTCGHAKCYTCMFKNESCTICANTQRHHQEMHDDISEFQRGNHSKTFSDYDTGIGSSTTLGSPQLACRSLVKTNGCFTNYMQQPSANHAVYSKPPKCPQQQHSLSHLRGLVDVSPNIVTTKAEICATPPQNRRRFFIPKHLKSPFALYKNRNGNSGGSSDQNYTFSAFFHKNFAGFTSMNSSTTTNNSESNIYSNTSPSQSIVKVKQSKDKENKLQRFGGAFVSGGTLVFGKIKSLWSVNGTGLNMLADSDRRQKSKIKEHLDDEKHASSNKSRTVKDDELQVRLGLFLENNNHSQARTKHKQSLNSLGSSNTSPLSTLTNSSEADMSKGSYRDKSQTSRRGCESIGSLLSVSISENSNASSNSMGRRHSITGNQNNLEGLDELAQFKARKVPARRSARSVQLSAPLDPKVRFAQYRTSAQLPLKPLFFEVPHQEADPIFVGRHWLVREISNAISTSECKGVIINGGLGTGKTFFILQMVEYSCFGRKKDSLMQEHDGIYCQVNLPNERLKQLASHVVAYHFCQSDNSPTCTVPDFVHSLAAQLCQAPQLAAYNEFLLNEPHLQNVLSIKECIADPQRALKMGILEPLDMLKRQGKILSRQCLILIDALCESEYHRPDYGDTITSFLGTMCHNFPSWLKVVATVRTQMMDYTSSLPFTKITLDNYQNDTMQKDILDYIVLRLNHSPSIQNNISHINPSGTLSNSREGTSMKFAQHLLTLSKGSFLFAKLTLDLIERGHLVVKSNSFKVLPVTLSQIFLLNFNLRYPTQSAFEKISPILAVCLAALNPLTLIEIFHSVNALVTEAQLEWNDFLNRFKMLAGFLVKRIDNTYMFFHPSFREWLIMRRDDGESAKFLCDPRTGHAAIAFRMSRLQAPLDPEQTLELCHHILKAHIYRTPPVTQAPRDLQAFWVASSAKNISSTLCTLRNIYNPNIKVSRLLLLAGADPDYQTQLFGNAPLLCIAANEGILSMVNLLIEFGADVEKANNQGSTPLIIASIKGHFEIIQQLVTTGSYLGQTDTQQRCALVHAALNGHSHIVKYLLSCDWIQHESRNDMSLMDAAKQALVSASSRGHTSIVEDLLLSLPELDIDAIDFITGENSLTIGSSNGHTETVSLLLSRGANHYNKNRKGMNALLLAVKEGHWNIVERLLQSRADIEVTDQNSRNALMIAAEEGHVGIMELLLNKGADHGKVDKDGLSALSWACLRGKLLAAKSLLEHNADICHQDNHQRTPLDLAAYQGTGDLVQMLLENGAQIEHVDEKGMRPIDRAIACRNIKVVQVFLKHGAKLGSSTWFLAQSKPEIMIVLLNKLLEDGNVLYRKNRLQDASHRYEYALKKIPQGSEKLLSESTDDVDEQYGHNNTFQQLRFNFLINLSRCKRKMNEISESIDLATTAISIKTNNYDGYYARAKALMEANNLEEALRDTQRAIDKVKMQQKYQKVSTDVIETLSRLYEELSKVVENTSYQTIPDRIYHRQSHLAETTDL
ncbi:unnamed protein product [Chironomus riparius]|uniref:RING-type domain-containing protein n=1 Tax=Chironomus riparius TaxID=315576 RepID=A0A9P0NKR0_9DIPT|nr:unnamed protein product [Chironomus riparius]